MKLEASKNNPPIGAIIVAGNVEGVLVEYSEVTSYQSQDGILMYNPVTIARSFDN